MSHRNQLTILHFRIPILGLGHEKSTTRNLPAQLTIPPNDFIMIANTNRHFPYVPKIAPALGDLNSPVAIPPHVLLKPDATIILPDGVYFYEIEVIFHDNRVEEDGSENEE